jgi:amino-acid N-acetyltransferase
MVRKAKIKDTAQIHKLINFFAAKNLMLPRSLNEIYENLRDFWVYEHRQRVRGCCALHILWSDLAEIKSLVIERTYQRKGIGTLLVNSCIEEAKQLGAKSIFVLTYKADYFRRFGFHRIKHKDLPHKIWTECIKCPKFPDCKEVALIKRL